MRSQVAPPSAVRCSRNCKNCFGWPGSRSFVTAPTQPIFSFAQPMQRRYGAPGLAGSTNFRMGQLSSPPFKVCLISPLLFTSQPFFSSKNQMSSVRDVAVGEFVATTHFQSFAVLIDLFLCRALQIR